MSFKSKKLGRLMSSNELSLASPTTTTTATANNPFMVDEYGDECESEDKRSGSVRDNNNNGRAGAIVVADHTDNDMYDDGYDDGYDDDEAYGDDVDDMIGSEFDEYSSTMDGGSSMMMGGGGGSGIMGDSLDYWEEDDDEDDESDADVNHIMKLMQQQQSHSTTMTTTTTSTTTTTTVSSTSTSPFLSVHVSELDRVMTNNTNLLNQYLSNMNNMNNSTSSSTSLVPEQPPTLSLGPKLVHDSHFTYAFVPPHKLIRTIDMSVRMLHHQLSSNEVLDGSMSEQRAHELESVYEPFALPLPLPPNCKLYKQSLHYAIPGLESDLISSQQAQAQQQQQQQQQQAQSNNNSNNNVTSTSSPPVLTPQQPHGHDAHQAELIQAVHQHSQQQLLLQQQQQQQSSLSESPQQQSLAILSSSPSDTTATVGTTTTVTTAATGENATNNNNNSPLPKATNPHIQQQQQQQQQLNKRVNTPTKSSTNNNNNNNKSSTTPINAQHAPPVNSALSLIRRMDYPLPRRILPYPRGLKTPIGPSPLINHTDQHLSHTVSCLTLHALNNVPHHSVQLYQNSMGYVYEDSWNVEKVRPLITKSLMVVPPPSTQSSQSSSQSQSTSVQSQSQSTQSQSQYTSDKSKWQSMVLKKHALIQEVRERVYPLWRSVSFGHTFDVGTKEVKQALTDALILNVILQHLVFEGLKETKSTLEKESGTSYKWMDVDQSLLHAILKEAIKKTEKLYDLVLCDKIPATELQKQRNLVMKELEEMMAEFGLENDEDSRTASNKSLNDVNIWEEPHDGGVARNMVVEVDPIRKTEQFQAGSLNVLIQKLTADSSSIDDMSGLGVATTTSANSSSGSGASGGGASSSASASGTGAVSGVSGASGSLSNFTHAFLTTYLSFTTSEELFDKLVQRFHVPRHNMTEVEHFAKKEAVRASVVNVIRIWVQDYFSLLNLKLVNKILVFLEDEIMDDVTLRDEGMRIRSIVLQHQRKEQIMNELQQNSAGIRLYKNGIDDDTLASLDLLHAKIEQSAKEHNVMTGGRSAKMLRLVEEAKSYDSRIKSAPEPKIPKSLFAAGFSIMDADEEEIARQLSLVEFELFAQIQPQEFLNQAWNLTKLKYRAMNIIKMRQHYENMQLWVASLILTATKGDRKNALKKWIKVCDYLKQLRNFNTMRAILDALGDPNIQRLRPLWASIKDYEKSYQEMLNFISEHNNYAPYREALKQKPNEPCIPYLNQYLNELINIENNSKNYTKHNHAELINWTKREAIYEIISEIQKFQSRGYNLVRVYQLQKLIETMPDKLPRETYAKYAAAIQDTA